MNKIDLSETAIKYNNIKEVWSKSDKWHWFTYTQIGRFINKYLLCLINKSSKILNAGSAGYSYSIDENLITHIDIAAEKIRDKKKYIIGSIEKIELPNSCFDIIICVGSVINYCDPILVIGEFNRILNEEGTLILEFENSKTFEFIGDSRLNKKAVFVDTFYKESKERIWYFSEGYITEILKLNNFEVIAIKRVHLISPLILKIFKSPNFASKFVVFDNLAKRLPILNRYSSNVIIKARKITQ